ncbi:hypothetical protein BIW11_10510, partial [Tropilaelaps mercedesae]
TDRFHRRSRQAAAFWAVTFGDETSSTTKASVLIVNALVEVGSFMVTSGREDESYETHSSEDSAILFQTFIDPYTASGSLMSKNPLLNGKMLISIGLVMLGIIGLLVVGIYFAHKKVSEKNSTSTTWEMHKYSSPSISTLV